MRLSWMPLLLATIQSCLGAVVTDDYLGSSAHSLDMQTKLVVRNRTKGHRASTRVTTDHEAFNHRRASQYVNSLSPNRIVHRLRPVTTTQNNTSVQTGPISIEPASDRTTTIELNQKVDNEGASLSSESEETVALLSSVTDSIHSIVEMADGENATALSMSTSCSSYQRTRSYTLVDNDKCPREDTLISTSGDEKFLRVGCQNICNQIRTETNDSCVAFIHRSSAPHCQLFRDQSLHGRCDRERVLSTQVTLYELDCPDDDGASSTSSTMEVMSTTAASTTTTNEMSTTPPPPSSMCARYTQMTSHTLDCTPTTMENTTRRADCESLCDEARSTTGTCLAYAYSAEVVPNCHLFDERSTSMGGLCPTKRTAIWNVHETSVGCTPLGRPSLACPNVLMSTTSSQYSRLVDCGAGVELGRGLTEVECSNACLRDAACMTSVYQMEHSPSRCTAYPFNRYYDEAVPGRQRRQPKCVYCHRRAKRRARRFQMRQKGCAEHVDEMQYRTIETSTRVNGTSSDRCA